MTFETFYNIINKATDYAIASHTYLTYLSHQDVYHSTYDAMEEAVLYGLFDILDPIDVDPEDDDYSSAAWIADHWFSYLTDIDLVPFNVSEDKARDLYNDLFSLDEK